MINSDKLFWLPKIILSTDKKCSITPISYHTKAVTEGLILLDLIMLLKNAEIESGILQKQIK